jgi:hypothetical protein
MKKDIKDHTKLASDYQNLKSILGLGKYQSLMVILFTRLVNQYQDMVEYFQYLLPAIFWQCRHGIMSWM